MVANVIFKSGVRNVVRPIRLFCLMVMFMIAPFVLANDGGGLHDYVEQLNAQCPIDYKEDWCINSFTMVDDRYALVDLQVPSSLAMFLPSLSSNAGNVKQLWIKQLALFGDRWQDFVKNMVDADRPMVVNLHPKGSDETYLLTFLPTDF